MCDFCNFAFFLKSIGIYLNMEGILKFFCVLIYCFIRVVNKISVEHFQLLKEVGSVMVFLYLFTMVLEAYLLTLKIKFNFTKLSCYSSFNKLCKAFLNKILSHSFMMLTVFYFDVQLMF